MEPSKSVWEEVKPLIQSLVYSSESDENIEVLDLQSVDFSSIEKMDTLTWDDFLDPVCSYLQENDIEGKKVCFQFWQLKYWFDAQFEKSQIYKGSKNPIPIYVIGYNNSIPVFGLITHTVET